MERRVFCQALFGGIIGTLAFEEGLFRGITGSLTPLGGFTEEYVDKALEEREYYVPNISEEYKQTIGSQEFCVRIFGNVGDREKIKAALEYLKKTDGVNKKVLGNMDKVKVFHRKENPQGGVIGVANASDPSYRPRIVYCNREFLEVQNTKGIAGLLYHETTHISGHNDEIVPYLNQIMFSLFY